MKIKICRNLFASKYNPDRFFIFGKLSRAFVHGLKMDFKTKTTLHRLSEREKNERGWEESYVVVATIDVVVPDIEQLDEMFEKDSRCECGCCHAVDHGACDDYCKGANGRCVYCDHGEDCHPGSGEHFNLPLSVGVRKPDATQ